MLPSHSQTSTDLRAPVPGPTLLELYLLELARESTRDTMARALRTIAEHVSPAGAWTDFPWAELRYPHLVTIRAWLIERYAARTANKHLAALRGILRMAFRLGHLSAGARARLDDLHDVKVSGPPAGHVLSRADLERLRRNVANGSSTRAGRDLALLAAMYPGGLRRAEVCGLLAADWDGHTLRVDGKGGRVRMVPVSSSASAALDDWVAAWPRGLGPGPLFFGGRLGGEGNRGNRDRAISARGVAEACKRWARVAGLPPFSPHDLRRSTATHLLDAGVDVLLVSQLLGHSDASTTARYDRRQESALAEAVQVLG